MGGLLCALSLGFTFAACGGQSSAAATSADAGVTCAAGDPGQERWGTACLCCHTDEFGIAGSVGKGGPPVARIVVTDALGTTLEMGPDPYGNFFRHDRLLAPLLARAYAVDGTALEMPQLAPHGDCNACHGVGGSAAPIVGPP